MDLCVREASHLQTARPQDRKSARPEVRKTDLISGRPTNKSVFRSTAYAYVQVSLDNAQTSHGDETLRRSIRLLNVPEQSLLSHPSYESRPHDSFLFLTQHSKQDITHSLFPGRHSLLARAARPRPCTWLLIKIPTDMLKSIFPRQPKHLT